MATDTSGISRADTCEDLGARCHGSDLPADRDIREVPIWRQTGFRGNVAETLKIDDRGWARHHISTC